MKPDMMTQEATRIAHRDTNSEKTITDYPSSFCLSEAGILSETVGRLTSSCQDWRDSHMTPEVDSSV